MMTQSKLTEISSGCHSCSTCMLLDEVAGHANARNGVLGRRDVNISIGANGWRVICLARNGQLPHVTYECHPLGIKRKETLKIPCQIRKPSHVRHHTPRITESVCDYFLWQLNGLQHTHTHLYVHAMLAHLGIAKNIK